MVEFDGTTVNESKVTERTPSMDQGTTATVPNRSNGVSSNGDGRADGRDAQQGESQAEYLDQLLRERLPQYLRPEIEKTADGFRSTVDRRISEQERRQGQREAARDRELAEIKNLLGSFVQERVNAGEADLEPEERNTRQRQREIAAAAAREEQAVRVANAYAQQNRVLMACGRARIEYNDPNYDWRPDVYEQDPRIWADMMIQMVNDARANRIETEAQKRAQAAEEYAKQQAKLQQDRETTRTKNEQQTQAARTFTAGVPEGERVTGLENVERLSPKERTKLLRAAQDKIKHAGQAGKTGIRLEDVLS